MMEFIDSYNLTGLVIGISTFLIIGFFHPVVIKCEYYFGTRCWWIFLIFGVLGIISSLYVRQVLGAALLGVFAFSSFFSQRPGSKDAGALHFYVDSAVFPCYNGVN